MMHKPILIALGLLVASVFFAPSALFKTAHAAPNAPLVIEMAPSALSLPLRQMTAHPTSPIKDNGLGMAARSLAQDKHPSFSNSGQDQAMDFSRGKKPDAEFMPLGGWDGINAAGSDCFCLPPDINGDVGTNHYVQTVNTALQIWDKNGASVYGPTPNNVLFDGLGGPCETTNDGDPIILYDQLANRWFFSQFANVFTNGPYYQCFAVSATSDPLGSWYRYQMIFPNYLFNDYGKFGVMPDGYYMTANLFDGNSWGGAAVVALERQKMLNGQPAKAIYYNLGVNDWGGMLPADFDGTTLPASNGNYFVEVQDYAWDPSNIARDQLMIWKLTPNWNTPASSTLTNIANLPVKKFNGTLCGLDRNCVPQRGTTQKLDAIADRGMYRLQYRNFGAYESLVLNHTVKAKQRAGIRWYEIRVTGGAPTIYQQSTYIPDDDKWRWMGSAAMDRQGNLAIGFSKSSAGMYPSIFYAGRLASDPLNTLAQGEARMRRGRGAQLSQYARWGDYSMLAVDPADDCTFWFTTEYYSSTSDRSWKTWIGKFKFPGCS